ncbi:MAG: VTT domain-containing protein [Cytophagaceae bacterium]|jgi:membrane protein YqaA with SNARE-associated domain|nr:VTT domain-containing protein [Cytophagaceae bacterium]
MEYAALFLAAFLAATVLPFSSEVVLTGMLIAGYNPFWCIATATTGNWLGSLTCYWIGRLGKWDWVEKYLKIPASKIEKVSNRIKGKGGWIAFFSWIPGIGDPIVVVIGFLKVRFLTTAIWILAGKIIRYIVWSYITLNTINIIQT